MNQRQNLSYDDVLLKPQYSDIKSRSEIDISSDLTNGVVLRLPMLSSPMDTISEGAMGNAMGFSGASAIIHRYNTIQEQLIELNKVESPCMIGAAIGISGDYIERATAMVEAGANFLCVDVAHGHHITISLIGAPIVYDVISEEDPSAPLAFRPVTVYRDYKQLSSAPRQTETLKLLLMGVSKTPAI